jgi:hypothetical protein
MNVDLAATFPVPELPASTVAEYAERLWTVGDECRVLDRAGNVSNYNFNRRMDVLLEIDRLIVERIAPDLEFTRELFAEYKSNSFLRPLSIAETESEERESEAVE